MAAVMRPRGVLDSLHVFVSNYTCLGGKEKKNHEYFRDMIVTAQPGNYLDTFSFLIYSIPNPKPPARVISLFIIHI